MSNSDILDWLQEYYQMHCDGDWEHSYGFKIDNVDNPGWSVEIDLNDTKMSLITFEDINEQRSESDWIICKREHDKFLGYGGPQNLQEILIRFRDWVESNSVVGESIWINIH